MLEVETPNFPEQPFLHDLPVELRDLGHIEIDAVCRDCRLLDIAHYDRDKINVHLEEEFLLVL